MTIPSVRTIPIKHCNFEAKVKVGGSGPPLVYLHTAGGPLWDPFIDALADHFTVYAPDHPGTGDTARDAIHSVDSLWDLVLIYDEILDALNLPSVPLVGASFGGMMACEVAAHRPDRVSRMVLLDPIGLWRDDKPVAQYMLMPPEQLVATLFKLRCGAGQEIPDDADRPARTRDRHRGFDLGIGCHRKVRVAYSGQGVEEAHPSGERADPDHLGRRGRTDLLRLRAGIRETDCQVSGGNYPRRRTRPAMGATRDRAPIGHQVPALLRDGRAVARLLP
jgi:pimeloyl-ACP methyl ester carboxylesterase